VTYSIVARDPATGELGVAVQTDWFGVGSVVPWASPGVGAVATQSFAKVSYGPLGLELMRQGMAAAEALAELVDEDDAPALRQVAMVDADGGVAAHTGERCVEFCGDVQGDQVSVQANMMVADSVWPAMLEAYASAEGDLAAKLFAALEAGEGEGGDARGRQSAALLVVPAPGERVEPWETVFDVRVENHEAPIEELGRVLRYARAYRELDVANDLATEGDMDAALAAYARAAELCPEDDQIHFWHGLTLVGAGKPVEGREALERARAANPEWAPYLRRLPNAIGFPDDPAFLDAMLPLDPPEA
jgi:uncharacterized Ntn-hydrolase superfamily protein